MLLCSTAETPLLHPKAQAGRTRHLQAQAGRTRHLQAQAGRTRHFTYLISCPIFTQTPFGTRI